MHWFPSLHLWLDIFRMFWVLTKPVQIISQNTKHKKREKIRTRKQSSEALDDKKFDNIDLYEEKPKDENIGINSRSRRSQVNNECQPSESATIMIEKAIITYMKPLKAKINPIVDDQVTKPKVNLSDSNNPYRLKVMGIPTSYQSRILQRDNRQPYQCQVIVNNW